MDHVPETEVTRRPATSPHPAGDAAASEQAAPQEKKQRKRFGERGEVPFLAQTTEMALVLFPIIPLEGVVFLVGMVSLAVGILFILHGWYSLGRNITIVAEPRKKHALVTTGMYSYVRHPMYGGMIMTALGLAVVTKNETRAALAALLWYTLEWKVAYEEKMLAERYPEYNEYKPKVKKFIPFVY